MKFPILLLGAALALSLAACDNDGDQPLPDPVPEPQPQDHAFDLSAEAMANCYIVQEPGLYKLKADNQFNLGEGLPIPPQISPDSATLVWQTSPGLIKWVKLDQTDDGPYIYFEVEKPLGNALLAALDAEGNIAWSWHIWMPECEVFSVASSNGYKVMNLNLGAITDQPGLASSYGMLYQWGRKDPFPAAATPTGDTTTKGARLFDIDGNEVTVANSSWYSTDANNLAYSIANPTVVLSNYAQYTSSRDWLAEGDDALWGNPRGYVRDTDSNTFPYSGRKTCYDPSPAGWRVAPADAFRDFTSSSGYAWDFADFNIADVNGDGVVNLSDYNYGWHFIMSPAAILFFPAAARYDGSYAMLMGSVSGYWGNYWSNAPYPDIKGGAFCCLSFQTRGQNGEDWVSVSPSGGASKADAYSVRCIRE